MKTFRKSFIKKKPLGKASAKAQSAMEYLMTYGWAILIISVVLAALFQLGVFNPMTFAPKAPPGSCQVIRPYGPGTTSFINLEGVCSGELPQYTAYFSNTSLGGINVPSSPTINTSWSGGSYTITAWFDETALLNSSTYRLPLQESSCTCTSGFYAGGSSNTTGYTLGARQFYATSYNSFCANVPCGAVGVSYNGIPYNRFVFIADVFHYVPGQTGNYLAMCVNGNCDNVTWSEPYPPVDYASPSIGCTWWMGNSYWWGLGKEFGAYLADVQLYNTSLSQSELQALYQEGIGGAPIDLQHLVGWWPLNGNANDYSGNGNNGQISGNVNFVSNWYSGYTPP